MSSIRAAIAANRFGLGARPGDLGGIRDPVRWVTDQLGRMPIPKELASLPSSRAIVAEVRAARADRDEARRLGRSRYDAEARARTLALVTSAEPVHERLVRFWSNHFTVSVQKGGPMPALVGAYEREAVRPHATGRFLDLLTAVVHHPAMLVYLDQARSVGPGSRAGQRRPERGLNENLARELLELHTLGVDGGYAQTDVEALARVLTGLSIDRETGESEFAASRHEPGPKTLLGRTFDGEDEVPRVLAFLASHPSTMRHVCTKLARHVVDDDPPAAVVDAMVSAWKANDGRIADVVSALVRRDEAWDPRPRKLKTPEELVISAARGLADRHDADRLVASLRALGQAPWMAPSPAGWDDTAAAWSGPDAVLRRVQWAEKVGSAVDVRAGERGPAILGDLLGERTRSALSGPDGVALLVASPEFQRR